MKIKYEIRTAKPSDRDYIIKTWLDSYFLNSGFGKSVSKGIYYKYHNQMINRVYDNSKILVACDPNDDDFILGYVVLDYFNENDILHYAYVRKEARNCGLFKKMMMTGKRNNICSVTHNGPVFKGLRAYSMIVFNPYLFFDKEIL